MRALSISRRAATLALAGALAGAAPAAVTITLDSVTAGFSLPLYITNTGIPGDTRLFVLEQRGRIRIISGGSILGTDFLDLSSTGLNRISTGLGPGSERGLLGMAFPPDFATSLRFFVSYTNLSGNSVIERFTVPSALSNTANTTGTIVIGPIAQPQSNHNGGWIGFGPDGYLYAGLGDGGGGNDTGTGHTAVIGNAQDNTNLLGDMLRLDVSGATYTNPATNPFFGATAGLDEIYYTGLRNPWRNSFDFTTGMFFIGDVGQGAWEEVDIVDPATTAGANFGWRNYEGNVAVLGPAIGGTTFPVHAYGHTSNPNGNLAITGGYVYRGTQYPALQGHYLFADYNSGRIWELPPTGPSTWSSTSTELLDTAFQISSFGEDVSREIYVCEYADSGAGEVHHLRDTTVPVSLSVFLAYR